MAMTTYYIEQKITAFANQYRVFDSVSGEKGALAAFVHQKRMALRENILFYKDENKQDLLFQVKTQNMLEMAATYEVIDGKGAVLGSLKKDFSSSLLRSTWNIYSSEGDESIVKVQERSVPKAIIRRIWGLLPYIGDLPFFLKYHFDFIDPAANTPVGSYNKITLMRDHYRLDIEDKLLEKTDWRVLVAMGVSLDALQSR